MKYYLVLDVGTTGVKAFVFSRDLKVVARAYRRLKKSHPKRGWVEQSPRQILEAAKSVLRGAVYESKVPLRALRALGITNQRETAILWDRRTAKPVYPAIGWEDHRTVKDCARLKARGFEPLIRRKTGLVLDPYFSATKLSWILRRQGLPDGHRGGLASRYHLRFGTIDSWILWNLLEGQPHVTDFTNASRTLLFNIRTLKWDDQLLDIFEVPREILPAVRPSQSAFGALRKDIIGVPIPVTAVCGDQQASMYAVGAAPGATKITYGTGTFLVQSLGSRYVLRRPFFTTLMPGARRPGFALEAKIEGSGSAIDRVRHDPQLAEQMLRRIAKDVDVYFKKLPMRPKTVLIDGGITRDDRMAAIQSNISGVPVRRQLTEDGTALGVAMLLRDRDKK